jgi:hypothetical protein
MSLEPDWIADLLRLCAADDWGDVERRLGHASVSPMFARWLPDAEADGSYTRAEIVACRAALERLSREQPDEYAAIIWQIDDWRRRKGPPAPGQADLAARAARRLADWIDAEVDG